MNTETPPGWWLKFWLTFLTGAFLIFLYYTVGEILVTGLAGLALLVAVGTLAIGIYFIPTIIAHRRGHRQRTAIFVLNIFAGWTIIAWVLAMVWAFTADVEE
jgi:ABC-type branched-subunit amino acid transport system permease subunit